MYRSKLLSNYVFHYFLTYTRCIYYIFIVFADSVQGKNAMDSNHVIYFLSMLPGKSRNNVYHMYCSSETISKLIRNFVNKTIST